MTAVLYKVYCYRGKDKQIWFEAEDTATGQGVAWSPSKDIVLKKLEKLGYELVNDKVVCKFYKAK